MAHLSARSGASAQVATSWRTWRGWRQENQVDGGTVVSTGIAPEIATLVRQAHEALEQYAAFTQEQIDQIVKKASPSSGRTIFSAYTTRPTPAAVRTPVASGSRCTPPGLVLFTASGTPTSCARAASVGSTAVGPVRRSSALSSSRICSARARAASRAAPDTGDLRWGNDDGRAPFDRRPPRSLVPGMKVGIRRRRGSGAFIYRSGTGTLLRGSRPRRPCRRGGARQ